jgi:hypothetical protein
MEWMKGLLGQTPRKANNFKPKTSSALLVETPVKVSSPKRKRQASPERVQPIEEKAVESDPKDLLLEFMALKQNQILTQKDTEMVDQILKGQITRDQITLYCKPVTRMKRVKITKRPIQYRGVGLSSVKQVKKSEIVRPQKKVKVEATTDVAQTILDAIEQKDSMGFGIGLLPNPYTMDMPVVTISPVNSPQKLDVPKISFSFTAAAPLMNPFEKASPKAKDALAPVTENPKSPPKFGGITFTPSKEVAKEALFTPGFKKLQSQEDTIMSHDSPKASLGFVKPVPTPTDSPKASFGFVKPVPTPTESPISEASFVPVTPSAVAKAMPFAKESLSNQDSEKNTPFATMTIPKVFEIKESQALQQTVEKE